MNAVKNFTKIYLRLNQIDVLEVNDLSNKVCVPNETKNLNLSVFNMITGTNQSKKLSKHISRQYKCKLDG